MLMNHRSKSKHVGKLITYRKYFKKIQTRKYKIHEFKNTKDMEERAKYSSQDPQGQLEEKIRKKIQKKKILNTRIQNYQEEIKMRRKESAA